MKLEDVEKMLKELRFKKKQFSNEGLFKHLVEALTEYTILEPPRDWYLLEIPEPSPNSMGGWRKVVEIMKRRGFQVSSSVDQEILVHALADAYTFSESNTRFRKIVTALIIKISREAGLLHYWHRILYVSAKSILNKDLAGEDFDPIWDEPLHLDESFVEMSIPQANPDAESMDGMESAMQEYPCFKDLNPPLHMINIATNRRRKKSGKNTSGHSKRRRAENHFDHLRPLILDQPPEFLETEVDPKPISSIQHFSTSSNDSDHNNKNEASPNRRNEHFEPVFFSEDATDVMDIAGVEVV